MLKVCKTCKKLKQQKSFYVSYTYKNNKTYSVECKKCSCKRTVEYGRKNKDRRYEASIKFLYGITTEDYNRMLLEQNGVCKICGRTETHAKKKKFNIDHNHITGKVRGLLCNRCNVGLGKFKDDIEILKKAIGYLQCQN